MPVDKARRFGPLDDVHESRRRAAEAVGVALLAERGKQFLVEDTARQCVRQNLLETVADFDSRFSILDGDEEHRPVVGPLLADSPSGDLKTVAVVAIAPYERLISDINFLGTLAGKPELGQMVEGGLALFTQGKGPDALDKKKPWGVIAQSDGATFKPVLCLPVKNVDDLLNVDESIAGSWLYLEGTHPTRAGLAVIEGSHRLDWPGPEGFVFTEDRSSFYKAGTRPEAYAFWDVPGMVPLFTEPGDHVPRRSPLKMGVTMVMSFSWEAVFQGSLVSSTSPGRRLSTGYLARK